MTRCLLCAVVSLCLSLAGVTQDRLEAGRQRTFTRPTVVASPIPAPAKWREVIFDDSAFKIVARDYGNGGGQRPGLFVFSKKRDSWIEVLELSTEHARLGRSPEWNDVPAIAVSWDYARLANQDYASLPLKTSGSINFPDQVVDVTEEGAFRFDFNSRLKREQSLTSFWVRREDLEAAFGGRRRPR
jgi:hypothetical protein